MVDLLIKNVILDKKICDVAITGKIFSQIGENLEVSAAKVIDAGARYAITPPFYNTHTHHAMTLLRGYADDLELFDWLNNHIWPAEALLTEEDVYAGARLAILEMIKSGTVFFNDSYWHPVATARAAVEMGVKAEIGLLYLSIADGSTLKNEQNEVELSYLGKFFFKTFCFFFSFFCLFFCL
jgi:5-methylthioadenosine/S-adenosylhomocysteine deaminase